MPDAELVFRLAPDFGALAAMAAGESVRAESPRGTRSVQPTPMRWALFSLFAAMMLDTEEP